MIDISNMKTSSALADFSLRAANEMVDFVADEVFTPCIVSKTQFKYYQYDLSNYREVETQKGSKAEADKVDYGAFATSAKAELHKLAGEVDPQDERDADEAIADLEQDVALTVMERLMIKRERIMAGIVSTSANYNAGLSTTLAAGFKWSDPGGDPESDIVTAKKGVKGICGRMPNAMALSWSAWLSLSQSAALKDRVKYTSAQSLTVDQVKNLLQLDYLHICRAQYNANLEGNATQSLSDIWGTYALVYIKDPSQKKRTVCYGRNFLVNEFTTFQYEDVKRGGPEGRIKVIESSWEYVLKNTTLDSQAGNKIGGGYLVQNIF
jgi:hypothetical protein